MSFRRELLPPPRAFWDGELPNLGRANAKGWCRGRCLWHRSRSGQSFSVNIETGFWTCHAGCGGGDIIDFTMRRYRLSFKEACRRLACWSEHTERGGVLFSHRLVPYLAMDFTIDGVEHRAEVRDEPRTDLELTRRFYAEAADRLLEIRNGGPEQFENEERVQWGVLATAWELIQIEVNDVR